MGKSEKLVVLSVLLVVVLLFVWSLQGGGGPDKPADGVYAAESESATRPRMNERARRDVAPGAGSSAANLAANRDPAASEGGGGESGGTKMLLAETLGASAVEVNASGSARRVRSSMADPAVHNGDAESATSRSGVSRVRVRMQPGWDIITTSGLKGTVDPSMFLYDVGATGATWESLAKDLYGDEDKAVLLRHNNEGLGQPNGLIFVPAKDELGHNASLQTVEVLQGESLWQVAKRTLGKGSEWKAVYEANRDVIADPDFLAPGTILKIPIR